MSDRFYGENPATVPWADAVVSDPSIQALVIELTVVAEV